MSLTIMEAIDNLKKSSVGNEFVVNLSVDGDGYRLNKTFSEILEAIRNSLNPVIYADDGALSETYFARDRFLWFGSYYNTTDEITNCYITFVNCIFSIYNAEAEGSVGYLILYGDNTLKFGHAEFANVSIDG